MMEGLRVSSLKRYFVHRQRSLSGTSIPPSDLPLTHVSAVKLRLRVDAPIGRGKDHVPL
jgi:hypothetical protein